MILLILPGTNLLAQNGSTKQILILNTYDGSGFAYGQVTGSFRDELRRIVDDPIAFTEIDLDVRRSELRDRQELSARLLRNIYSQTAPDIVIAVGSTAITFWMDHRDSMPGPAPLIALIREGIFGPEDLRPGDIARFTELSFADLVDDFLHLRPGTSHIVMVFGSSPTERAVAASARRELAAYTKRLRFEYTNDMTIHELETRLGELSEESAVFFGLLGRDADGAVLPYDLGLSLVHSSSTAPIFGAFDYELGSGIVGGRLMQLQQLGVSAAQAGTAILQGEPVRDAWQVFEFSTPVYDWRELDRWGIDTGLLPVGSEIRYRPSSLWEQYAAWIILVATVTAVEGLLIISLLTHRRERRAAELAQKDLSGQLINAYEDERQHIARELHDDLSQRLARLAIDAEVIRHDKNSDTLDDELKGLREDLARVSEDVHDISYRLHPSSVEDLGISTALRAECQRVRKYADVPIKEYIGETRGRIPKNAALCAFRLIQEALNNAVRHARADSIEIVFQMEDQALNLEVSDDGHGFDKAQVIPGASIGLSSMRERVRLLNGTLNIQSTPGAGTTVSAKVPLTGENP